MKYLKPTALVLSLGYPFAVYWGLQHYEAQYFLPLIFVIIGLKWLVVDFEAERKVLLAICAATGLVIIAWGHQIGLKFYPVLMSLGFLFLFASSLISPPSIVERLAKLTYGTLSPQGVSYTRKVTWVWCLFFCVNASIATATAVWGSDKQWMLYNGFIAYVLIGCLAAGEWLVRQSFLRESHD